MGKIKNWKRRVDKPREIVWDNDLSVSTCVVSAAGKLWSVQAHSGEGYTLQKYKEFKSRAAAKKFAIAWMRKHPKGQ